MVQLHIVSAERAYILILENMYLWAHWPGSSYLNKVDIDHFNGVICYYVSAYMSVYKALE